MRFYLGRVKAVSFKDPWLTSYVEKLFGLSATTKRAIIRALERSMDPKRDKLKEKEERKKKLDLFWSSFGSWEGDGSAEELAASIRNSRTVNPDREPL